MAACPCCVSDADKALLHSKPLHQLTDHELRRYASKAMTTWGDTDDFKHFLPRILELVSLADFCSNAHTVLGKLQYGNWREWPENEQERVNEFLLVWWTELVSLRPNFDGSLVIEFYQVMGTLEPLLDRWSVSSTDYGFYNFIDFINRETPILVVQKGHYKGIDEIAIHKLKQWLIAHLEMVELAFYHFEKTDPARAESIAAGYDKLVTIHYASAQHWPELNGNKIVDVQRRNDQIQ